MSSQAEGKIPEGNSLEWTQILPLAVFLTVVEVRVYLLLRFWTGQITGEQLAHKVVPPSGAANPLIYTVLLVALLVALLCYRRVRWLSAALLLSIPGAFIFMIAA
jgi:hypothetical protein